MANSNSSLHVSVVCWNVLADSYADYSKNQTWASRAPLLRATLTDHLADIILLQEVDRYEDFYRPFFEEHGYCCEYSQRPEKCDGCLIAYRSHFTLLSSHTIQFDDIASQYPYSMDKYLRHNIAQLIQLTFKETSFLVANCHLFWNPAFEDVKTAQARYLLQQIHAMTPTSMPTILGGDFNSFPDTPPYFAITDPTASIPSTVTTPLAFRFLCEPSLARLCRWLRVLGVEANTFDTTPAQNHSTAAKPTVTPTANTSTVDYTAIFHQCAEESAILLSSSKSLLARRNCPPAHFISPLHLPHALIYLYYTYPNLPLSRSQFLTICSKCGSKIEECEQTDDRITASYVPTDRQIYICTNCHQTYWWNERVNSTPARAMVLAKCLYTTVTTALEMIAAYCNENNINYKMEFEQVRDILVSSGFEPNISNWVTPPATSSENTDINEINELFEAREAALSSRTPTPEQRADVICNVECEPVDEHPLKLRSAYLSHNKKEPDYTNWTHEFIGTLDYIFVGGDGLTVSNAETLPPAECGGPFPNVAWPSDHMMILTDINIDV